MSKTASSASKTSFRDAYGVLKQHAETLRSQKEPNIDDLLTLVTESVAAYKICQERIDAVEKALQQALDSVDSPPQEASSDDTEAPKRSSRKDKAVVEPPADIDDDIPF
ncbi:exodeoxyribonuclease VII small subunit [Amphibiibacter pelophylacis]|uniref:Exodeoxyribonuclease VII small subunit n=1 Tax=Amphibiibacter pelophylacis TaxID=1799477 RepID=A0ACC6P394_9BURK